MLESELIQPAILSRARRIEQRRVALTQRDHLMMMAVERQKFAVPPNTALIEHVIRHAAFAPGPLPRRRIHASFIENYFEQACAANRTIVDRLVNRKARAAVLLKTRQLS